jgi:hypothetical protein
MSTKSSIIWGPDFHLYTEAYDRNSIYLTLPDTAVERDDGDAEIAIPLPVWECIRHYTSADFTWADRSDEQISEYVKSSVDSRIADTDKHPLMRICGAAAYGLADSPRDEQIEKGIKFYQTLRAEQQELREAIALVRERKR